MCILQMLFKRSERCWPFYAIFTSFRRGALSKNTEKWLTTQYTGKCSKFNSLRQIWWLITHNTEKCSKFNSLRQIWLMTTQPPFYIFKDLFYRQCTSTGFFLYFVGCSVEYFVVLGMFKSFGLFFVQYQRKYNTSASAISMIISVQNIIASFSCKYLFWYWYLPTRWRKRCMRENFS